MMETSCGKCSRLCASRVPIFENLDCDELEEIALQIEHKSFDKGSMIFTEGSDANTLFFINVGKIKLYKYNKDGKRQNKKTRIRRQIERVGTEYKINF